MLLSGINKDYGNIDKSTLSDAQLKEWKKRNIELDNLGSLSIIERREFLTNIKRFWEVKNIVCNDNKRRNFLVQGLYKKKSVLEALQNRVLDTTGVLFDIKPTINYIRLSGDISIKNNTTKTYVNVSENKEKKGKESTKNLKENNANSTGDNMPDYMESIPTPTEYNEPQYLEGEREAQEHAYNQNNEIDNTLIESHSTEGEAIEIVTPDNQILKPQYEKLSYREVRNLNKPVKKRIKRVAPKLGKGLF